MATEYLGIKLETDSRVYEPEEDSYLLADSLDIKGGTVLDVGTGTGIQALVAAKTAKHVLGVDVNPHAVELAEKNAKANKAENVSFKVSDLFEEADGKFDHIIFNPPYLPVYEEGTLEAAWAGGKEGAEVIQRFIPDCPQHLKDGGQLHLLVSSFNNPGRIHALLEGAGFTVSTAARKKLFFEELRVLKATY